MLINILKNLSRAVFLLCSVSSCNTNTETPQQQIQQFVKNGKTIAESRDIMSLKELISEQYRDDHSATKNGNKQALLRRVAGYFWRYKNIHIFTRINNLTFSNRNNAKLQLLVAMANLPVNSIDTLLNSSARFYQFDMTLIREKSDWKLLNTNWRTATSDDFFNNE